MRIKGFNNSRYWYVKFPRGGRLTTQPLKLIPVCYYSWKRGMGFQLYHAEAMLMAADTYTVRDKVNWLSPYTASMWFTSMLSM